MPLSFIILPYPYCLALLAIHDHQQVGHPRYRCMFQLGMSLGIVCINRQHHCLAPAAQLKVMSPQEVLFAQERGVTLLDVRPEGDYLKVS